MEADRVMIKYLPDEVLQQLLYYLSPLHIAQNVCLVSRRFSELAKEPLLWRYFCRHGYKYWDEEHGIVDVLAGSVGNVDWQAKFVYRHQANACATRLLNSILGSTWGRIDKYNQIAEFGYDVKEVLLHHSHSTEAVDILARRYHALTALNLIHRRHALKEWDRLSRGAPLDVERTLGCFDLFVLRDEYGDQQEISSMLDALARRLREENSNIDSFSTRAKALEIIAFLRSNQLVGLASEDAYRDMQNNYLHVALQASEHPSLPLISAALFCAVASRFHIDARCSNMPAHVYAMVFSDVGQTLDGTPSPESEVGDDARECMYLDPYRTHEEIPAAVLPRMLQAWGVPVDQHAHYMAPCQATTLAIRTSRNILTTVQEYREQQVQGPDTHPSVQIHGHPAVDLESSFYSALWANFFLSTDHAGSVSRALREFFALIVEKVDRTFPEDAYLVLEYARSKAISTSLALQEAQEQVKAILQRDDTPCRPQLRTRPESDKIMYKVGQVFRHKRYGYLGVITGWDAECSLGNEWIARNRVDSLSRGRQQSFYNTLVEDNSMRYVAEENIEIVTPHRPELLMDLAGRHFKRWDAAQQIFVSNMKDMYPDD